MNRTLLAALFVLAVASAADARPVPLTDTELGNTVAGGVGGPVGPAPVVPPVGSHRPPPVINPGGPPTWINPGGPCIRCRPG